MKIYPNDYKNNDKYYNLYIGMMYGSLCCIGVSCICILVILITKLNKYNDSSGSY